MERLILCGGGHVSLELAHIAARLEFEVVVIDDRPEFASETRFPMVQQVLCLPFEQALDQLGSRDTDFYAILTRGHAFDKECLAHVLRGRHAYVGMIGSRTKVAAVYQALRGEDFSQEMLDGVYSPIGLSIGGQTPAEIAVSGGGLFPGNAGRGILPHRSVHRGPDPGGDRCVHRRSAGAGPRRPGAGPCQAAP